MSVGLDIRQDRVPAALDPIPGMGVVAGEAGFLVGGHLEEGDGVGRIPQGVHPPERFGDPTEGADQIHHHVFVGDVAGRLVGQAGLAQGI